MRRSRCPNEYVKITQLMRTIRNISSIETPSYAKCDGILFRPIKCFQELYHPRALSSSDDPFFAKSILDRLDRRQRLSTREHLVPALGGFRVALTSGHGYDTVFVLSERPSGVSIDAFVVHVLGSQRRGSLFTKDKLEHLRG